MFCCIGKVLYSVKSLHFPENNWPSSSYKCIYVSPENFLLKQNLFHFSKKHKNSNELLSQTVPYTFPSCILSSFLLSFPRESVGNEVQEDNAPYWYLTCQITVPSERLAHTLTQPEVHYICTPSSSAPASHRSTKAFASLSFKKTFSRTWAVTGFNTLVFKRRHWEKSCSYCTYIELSMLTLTFVKRFKLLSIYRYEIYLDNRAKAITQNVWLIENVSYK